MANFDLVIVPETAFVFAGIFDGEQTTKRFGFEGVEQMAGNIAGTKTGQINSDGAGRLSAFAPEHRAGKKISARAVGLPGMALLRFEQPVTNRFAVAAFDISRRR